MVCLECRRRGPLIHTARCRPIAFAGSMCDSHCFEGENMVTCRVLGRNCRISLSPCRLHAKLPESTTSRLEALNLGATPQHQWHHFPTHVHVLQRLMEHPGIKKRRRTPMHNNHRRGGGTHIDFGRRCKSTSTANSWPMLCFSLICTRLGRLVSILT